MNETSSKPDPRFVLDNRSDWTPSRLAARALVNEAAFAVGRFRAAQAENGLRLLSLSDAGTKAERAVEAVSTRPDTAQVLSNAGLDAQSAKADLAVGRTDRLSYAFQTPPLGERHNYGPPSAAERGADVRQAAASYRDALIAAAPAQPMEARTSSQSQRRR